MNADQEKNFTENVKQLLEASTTELDAKTLTRLQTARRRAVELATRRKNVWSSAWLLPAGGVVAAATAFSVVGLLWFSTPLHNIPAISPEATEVLSVQDDLEIYRDLEFYNWLVKTVPADQPTDEPQGLYTPLMPKLV